MRMKSSYILKICFIRKGVFELIRGIARGLVIFLILILLLSGTPDGQAAGLEITGTGLVEDVIISNWNNYSLRQRFYSSNNNFDFHKIWKVKGYDFFDLLGSGNLKTDQDYTITFIASDGAKKAWRISALRSLNYYSDFTIGSGQRVLPMIGFYRAELFDNLGLPSEVEWQDRTLTEADKDDRAPRLYIGQTAGNVSDKNQQFFIRDLARIQVGEVRPSPPAPQEPEDPEEPEDPDEKPNPVEPDPEKPDPGTGGTTKPDNKEPADPIVKPTKPNDTENPSDPDTDKKPGEDESNRVIEDVIDDLDEPTHKDGTSGGKRQPQKA
jgi:hypothetical protein